LRRNDEASVAPLEARSFDEPEAMELEARSKIGRKFKNFFKKVGKGLKKAGKAVSRTALTPLFTRF
jgi:hypothetical protein